MPKLWLLQFDNLIKNIFVRAVEVKGKKVEGVMVHGAEGSSVKGRTPGTKVKGILSGGCLSQWEGGGVWLSVNDTTILVAHTNVDPENY